MEFTNPFPGMNPGDKLAKQQIISALRLSLCAEEDATHLYDTIANYLEQDPNNEQYLQIIKIMRDVGDEEQVHVGEFQKLLKIYEEDEEEKVKEGEDEAEEKINESLTPTDIAKLIT